MATVQGFPKWLLNCKDDITKSKEWSSFLKELHDAIQQQLTESHVQYFTDLSEPEKELFMLRATKAIEGGNVYKNVSGKVSNLLDQHLNNDVAKQLLEDYPIDTKSDLIIEGAEEGALSLLKKWPEFKSKLHICLNQPLPPTMRQLAWRLYLSNTKFRKTYLELLKTDRKSCISPHDLDISRKCEQLLLSEPTFDELKGSVGAFYAMKAVLSYNHAIQRSKTRVRDMDYMLIVPFVQVAAPNFSRNEPAPNRVVAMLVEEFLTFNESKPGYITDSGSQTDNEEMTAFSNKVLVILEKLYPEIPRIIGSAYVPSQEKTEASSKAVLTEGLTMLIRPFIRAVFVGYLKMDVLLYVWDQYIIGLDIPGFGTEWLAVVTATLLGLLQEYLKNCNDPTELENIIAEESPKLTIPQFQYEVKRHHYRDLLAMLTKDQKAAMPVLDPTQASHPPWRHWHNDVIPPFTKPQDRRTAREEREAERERLLQQQKDAKNYLRDQEYREKREEEEEYTRAAAAERFRVEQERLQLEDQLYQERKLREENERRAQQEIERLRMEVEILKYQHKPMKSPTPSVNSSMSFISRVLLPPPPTAASQTPGPGLPVILESPTHTPSRGQTPRQQTQNVVLDFLNKIRKTVDIVSHGEGDDRFMIESETDKYIEQNIADIKRAEVEVLGQRLKPGEFEAMPYQKQQEISDDMMVLIQKWREDRRAAELRQSRQSL
ncbi:hypothetical protein LOTGIDRAFT_171946 [Lottia gigantea]|uniref:Uncharacterized protein n=1 Tax=Lottia gigantea TaxID=225164 RepID=V4BA13_LOTGI|nr:hypothetical protein LOTGIDRAFT_171946 [Lottia gigantea]ESP02547.1 hypothetical protein LOTGIDRAFT_171946 [Lottia gigantea]